MPESDVVLSYAAGKDGRVEIYVPAGAVDEELTLYFDTPNAVQAQSQRVQTAKRAFQLIVYRESLALYNYNFHLPLEIAVTYTDEAIGTINEDKLMLFAYDSRTGSWTTNGITKIFHDPETNELIVDAERSAIFALGAENEQIFLPLVVR